MNSKECREPVALYRLVRASGGGRRSGQRRLTPLIGREEEIEYVDAALEADAPGRGPIRADRRRARPRQIAPDRDSLPTVRNPTYLGWNLVVRSSCKAHRFTQSLIGDVSVSAVRIWPPKSGLADLENTLALVKLDPFENATLLAPLLDIPLPTNRVLRLPPEELRRRQLAALANW